MQHHPLLISSIIRHAVRHHRAGGVVCIQQDGSVYEATYAQEERRMGRLARALTALGMQPGMRIGTLAWNDHRHFEIYYAVSGSQSICHTINPRLSTDDIGYIISQAQDRILFADPDFAPLLNELGASIAGTVGAVIFLCDAQSLPECGLPSSIAVMSYESLLSTVDDEAPEWMSFEETTASSLCYTSGTTGRPKGVFYTHRSTLLHALATNSADGLNIRAADRVMPVVPMFHVNAWGIPYVVPMVGATLVLPGRQLDGASLVHCMNRHRVSFSLGVPTVWQALLDYLDSSGERLTTLTRVTVGGSACPAGVFSRFAERGIQVSQGWGMTETSPIGSLNLPSLNQTASTPERATQDALKQGRAPFGVDLRVVNDAGQEQPWNGVTSGSLQIRGHWVISSYAGETNSACATADGWFTTGDIACIDEQGLMKITDRTKDIIKSGGEWISSIALENFAAEHPAVAHCAAIAARHPKWGERPLLLCTARPETVLDPAEVLAHIASRVPRWWIPDALIVLDELPRTATGKILKTELRSRFGDHLTGGSFREGVT